MSNDWFERRVVVSGVGQSQIGRRLDRSGFQLTLDAIVAAVADAGLQIADVDGMATYPGGGKTNLPGYSGGNLYEIQDALGLLPKWRSGWVEGGGLPIYPPMLAVATGQCRHAVVYRTVKEGSAAKAAGGRPAYGSVHAYAEGPLAWLTPVGALSPVCQIAPYMQRYMYEYGVTREQIGWIAVTQRTHAGMNPDAVYRDPLSLDDYLNGRMISTPISLFDCDVPVDGTTAIVVSAADTVADLRSPVRVNAIAGVAEDRPLWEQHRNMAKVGYATAQAMYNRTDLRPSDVDTAQLYDGFSVEAIWWLEALGFCAEGEGGSFVEDGKRITLGGDLPLNTWGGQLSGGRVHAGMGHIVEAVRQLRGEAGERQVAGAEVAAVTVAGGFESSAALLTTL